MSKLRNLAPKIQHINQRSKIRFYTIALLLPILVIILVYSFNKLTDWTNKHEIVKQQLFTYKFAWPYKIQEKQEPKEIVREVLPEPANPEEVDTPIKKYACDKWLRETKSDAYCLTMVAVFQAESGWDNEKWNYNTNDTLDYGIAQINSIHWKKPGCALVDITIPDKNVDCAYKIWDRADGEEGNGRGSFTPWVAHETGAFLAHLE